jgi:hypothetical protein
MPKNQKNGRPKTWSWKGHNPVNVLTNQLMAVLAIHFCGGDNPATDLMRNDLFAVCMRWRRMVEEKLPLESVICRCDKDGGSSHADQCHS